MNGPSMPEDLVDRLQQLRARADAMPGAPDVFPVVAARKHRRRVIRRFQVASLILVVVASTAGTTYVLARAFGVGKSQPNVTPFIRHGPRPRNGLIAYVSKAEGTSDAYDSAYTFIFSPRPGTEAATMTRHFVDAATCAERFERLRVVVERSALAKHRARIGRIEEALVEGPSKKRPGMTTGRTRQGKLVHFPPPGPLRPGTYADVEIMDAAPHHLVGRLVEVTADPTHRTRIAVVAV